MNLKRRLSALETQGTQSGDGLAMVREHLDTLLPLFVATEVTWWPFRSSLSSNKVTVAIHERRRQYRAGGLPWSGPGGSAANWKRSERQRAALVAAGLITMESRRGVPLVRLTDTTLATIRALVGAPQLDRGAKVLRAAAAVLFDEASPFCRGGGWVGETLLSGRSYEELPLTRDWHQFESMALPLLVAGALESRSSGIGHIFYKPTDIEPEYRDGPAVEVDMAIQDKYLDLWSLDARTSWVPVDLSEVVHGLPATR